MDEDLERGNLMSQSKQNQNSNVLDPPASPTLVNAGKMIYVKQVTGKHKDNELQLAARQGDLKAVKHMFDEIGTQMVGTLSAAEVAKIQASMVNELGETALYAAAENGHIEVVKELFKVLRSRNTQKKNIFGI